tara:strand:+ start:152613 stop:153809 length:1197 start_codon:yes stop_codon:yes gene_type:complete
MKKEYEFLATGRKESMFKVDIENNLQELNTKISQSRIAIIGAAGSIGSSVVRELVKYNPKEVCLFDINENNLVEVVRELRSSSELNLPSEFSALPIGLGSYEFLQFFKDHEPFDYVFNLCALKHVRTEKDKYCIKRMIDTNILFINSFLKEVGYSFKKFFSVSSDKAVAPANVMGASKMAMEKILLLNSEKQPFTSARFANVAFSDGSLPYSFLNRINKRQPIVAPSDIKRYFISHEEAAQLCVLAAMIGKNKDVFFPKMLEELHEKTFKEIALSLLETLNIKAIECSSEEEAKNLFTKGLNQNEWPCYFPRSTTSGEKPYEEFFKPSDTVNWDKFDAIGFVSQDFSEVNEDEIHSFLNFAYDSACSLQSKKEYIINLKKIVHDFQHIETNRNLDQKM